MQPLRSLTAALLLGSGLSMAVELSLAPSVTSVQEGDIVSVDVVAADLGNFTSPSLGAFYAVGFRLRAKREDFCKQWLTRCMDIYPACATQRAR